MAESYVRSRRGGGELEIAYELRQFNESNVFPSRSTEWIHDLDNRGLADRAFMQHSSTARFRVYCQLAARIFPLPLSPPTLSPSNETRATRDAYHTDVSKGLSRCRVRASFIMR